MSNLWKIQVICSSLFVLFSQKHQKVFCLNQWFELILGHDLCKPYMWSWHSIISIYLDFSYLTGWYYWLILRQLHLSYWPDTIRGFFNGIQHFIFCLFWLPGELNCLKSSLSLLSNLCFHKATIILHLAFISLMKKKCLACFLSLELLVSVYRNNL